MLNVRNILEISNQANLNESSTKLKIGKKRNVIAFYALYSKRINKKNMEKPVTSKNYFYFLFCPKVVILFLYVYSRVSIKLECVLGIVSIMVFFAALIREI